MNDEIDISNGEYESPFTSHDCIDLFFDGPGDTTVRPITGERRKWAEAEWAKIQYWTAVERGEIDPEKTPPPPEYQAPPRP
jgi:hypothetical protein